MENAFLVPHCVDAALWPMKFTKEGVLGKTIFSKGGLQHDYTIVGPTGVLRHDLTLTHVFYKKRIIE